MGGLFALLCLSPRDIGLCRQKKWTNCYYAGCRWTVSIKVRIRLESAMFCRWRLGVSVVPTLWPTDPHYTGFALGDVWHNQYLEFFDEKAGSRKSRLTLLDWVGMCEYSKFQMVSNRIVKSICGRFSYSSFLICQIICQFQ